MTTKLRVSYSRKVSEVGTFTSTSYGIEVEVDVPKDGVLQDAYLATSAIAQALVDSQIEQLALTPHGGVAAPPAAEAAAAPAVQTTAAEPAAAQPAAEPSAENVVEIPDSDTLVAYSAARVVFDPETKTDAKGNDYITVRLDHEDIPGRYRHGKSYDPEVMHAIETLRKGDRVDISGKYERPWTDRKGQPQAALIVEEVERVHPDAAAK